jgi:DGQHR domain-containing protein
MITVPAHRVKQFGVEFFQASFSAKDIDRLVKFEVLGYTGSETAPKPKRGNRARVNWEMLEKRIAESESAYQRPVIRRKIDELVAYYRDCKEAGTLPAIPGAVIITSEKRFTFTPMASQHDLGLLQIPEEHGVLRVLDGQHRLLALHALTQAGENLGIEVPAVLFDRVTGQIDQDVAEHWRQRYDISRRLITQAQVLIPTLRDKIHIAVGTADEWHLDEPVRLLDRQLGPLGYNAKFSYLVGWGHFGLSEAGAEVASFQDVMIVIAQQMYATARPSVNWRPRIAPHPRAELTK